MAAARTKPRSSRPVPRTAVRPAPAVRRLADDYWSLSAGPLHALALLTPAVLLYEIGAIVFLTQYASGTQRTIFAEKLLGDFLNVFGLAGLLVPALAMLTMLLIQHVLRRDPWTVKPPVLLVMVLESACWALPLLVASAIVQRIADGAGPAATLAQGQSFEGLGLGARLTISLGAGIYEELLFRLIGVALVSIVAGDLLQLDKRLTAAAAVVLTALAFAFYHPVWTSDGALVWGSFVFYVLAGAYFAGLYLHRGFGVVVLAHAAYDVLVLVLLQRLA